MAPSVVNLFKLSEGLIRTDRVWRKHYITFAFDIILLNLFLLSWFQSWWMVVLFASMKKEKSISKWVGSLKQMQRYLCKKGCFREQFLKMASETALFCRIIHELDDAYFQMKQQQKMENEFKTDLRSFVSSPKDWPELTKFVGCSLLYWHLTWQFCCLFSNFAIE